ncbi:hypothetical protein FSP39_008699 [Pinctada imbricata]|uniref:Tc1-like transposase DDE domain-containing protein n=1 Tax=Pinctada imbricata TaxID=66713 RepID=A0AA88YSB3_PINIB|nr:hypothetical protein FSP39_008699 [Pinctada imbricata]
MKAGSCCAVHVSGDNETRHSTKVITFGGGSVTVWGCFSNDCKLDMFVLDGTLNAVKYRDNILRTLVVPRFENHTLASRPIFMDDYATPHRARVVGDYLQKEAIDGTFSPDMNPIEHVLDIIGRKINQSVPPCRDLAKLRTVLVHLWNNTAMHILRRLVAGMRRRVVELYQKRGGYTKY